MRESQIYLLAGGNGIRAGGPKAWMEHEGKTLLARQVEFLLERFPAPKIAVTMQLSWNERCQNLSSEICWVPENPKESPMAAFQALLKSQPMRDWSYLYHVDHPVWSGDLFDTLGKHVEQAVREGNEAVVPVHSGKGGHPVVLSPGLSDALLGLDAKTARLDEFLRERRVLRVEVEQSCVLENWNVLPG